MIKLVKIGFHFKPIHHGHFYKRTLTRIKIRHYRHSSPSPYRESGILMKRNSLRVGAFIPFPEEKTTPFCLILLQPPPSCQAVPQQALYMEIFQSVQNYIFYLLFYRDDKV